MPDFKGKKRTMAYKKGPFTMKGSPMQRNFGVSPAKDTDWAKAYKLASASGSGATPKQIADLKQKMLSQKGAQKAVIGEKTTEKGKEYIKGFRSGELTHKTKRT